MSTPPSSPTRHRARPAFSEPARAYGRRGETDLRRRRATLESSPGGRACARGDGGEAGATVSSAARPRSPRSACAPGRAPTQSSRRSPSTAGPPRRCSRATRATRPTGPRRHRRARRGARDAASCSRAAQSEARRGGAARAGTTPGRRDRRRRSPRAASRNWSGASSRRRRSRPGRRDPPWANLEPALAQHAPEGDDVADDRRASRLQPVPPRPAPRVRRLGRPAGLRGA